MGKSIRIDAHRRIPSIVNSAQSAVKDYRRILKLNELAVSVPSVIPFSFCSFTRIFSSCEQNN